MLKIRNMIIVGLHFYIKKDSELKILKSLIGGQVLLEREPNNKYDSNAIVASYKTMKLGYVPRDKAKKLSPAIKGKTITFGKIMKIEENPLRLIIDLTVRRRK